MYSFHNLVCCFVILYTLCCCIYVGNKIYLDKNTYYIQLFVNRFEVSTMITQVRMIGNINQTIRNKCEICHAISTENCLNNVEW